MVGKKRFDTERRVIFAAMSKRSFYLREHIIKYILEKGCTPTCAFMMFSYFLLDTVDRRSLICANNDLIRRSDELWVFGDISDGVVEEVKLADRIKIPVRYFEEFGGKEVFREIKKSEAKVEDY